MNKLTSLFVLNIIICACMAQPNDSDKPNILLIISEDNSPLLGSYGDEFATTPNIDRLASIGVRYTHAFANAPVCAPARNTMMTGMYPPALGTEHMRSVIPIPEEMKFFTYYLREAGYFTSSRQKEDYNTLYPVGAWDVPRWSDWKDAFSGREENQPFFVRYNSGITHESQIHSDQVARNSFYNTFRMYGYNEAQLDSLWGTLNHDPEKVIIPPYHPPTTEMKSDWAKYYDRVQAMDLEVGEIMKYLKKNGLYDNTIIIHFSDHGGVLGRSKRFLFESGLHVPFMVWAPEKYQHLIGEQGGIVSDRLISFVDIAPTVLSLAGVEIPDHLQGNAFLGNAKTADPNYVFGFRGRMDERYDFSRTVFDGKFRYTRNYNPDRIYLQKLNYLWKAPSMASWHEAYKNEELDSIQSMFFEKKPVEEFYDVENDPHNINNLATDPAYADELAGLSVVLDNWIVDNRDVGFIPEGEMVKISRENILYDYMRSGKSDFEQIKRMADMAIEKDSENLDVLVSGLGHINASIRYWSVYGLKLLDNIDPETINKVKVLSTDESVEVRIQVSEALYFWDEKEASYEILSQVLQLRSGKLERIRRPGGYAQHWDENTFHLIRALNLVDLMGEDAIQFKGLLEDIPEEEEQFVKILSQNILEEIN